MERDKKRFPTIDFEDYLNKESKVIINKDIELEIISSENSASAYTATINFKPE